MVFNEGFDRSLFLLIIADKKNRDSIAKLIYDIPEELYFRIIEYLNKDLGDSCDIEFKQFSQAKRDNDTEDNYIYRIEINSEELKINFNKWSSLGNKLEENIVLSLFSISSSDLLTIDDLLCVGNYFYNRSQFLYPGSSKLSVISDDRNYEVLEKTPSGLVMCTSDYDKSFNVIDLNKLSFNMERTDLRDKRSVRKLVRGRRKK